MPFNRPTLQTLLDRAAADIEARLPGADARLRRTLLGVLARIHAGGMHGLYGYLDWLAKQLMPDTADLEHLDRHASVWGIDRKAATAAQGQITFTGTDATQIPAGTAIQRSDGALFSSDAIATIAAGSVLVAITADSSGANANTAANTVFTLVSPLAGINSNATVDASGLTGGADTETDDSLRTRLLARIKDPAHGGKSGDYVTWALEVAGVTRAWVYAQELGLGTVSVRFMMDDAYADGIPQAADVAAVQAYIDVLRPVTADLTVVAPIADALAFTIQLTPNDAATQAAVQAELADLIKRESIPAGTILLSHIREAISIAAGETDHVLVAPAADVTHATGHIATLGVITWQ